MLVSLIALQRTPPPELAAWVVAYNPASQAEFMSHAGRLKEAMVVALNIDASGTVQDAGYWKRADLDQVMATAKAKKVRSFLTLHNYAVTDFDAVRVETMMADPAKVSAAGTTLVGLAQSYGADGIDLDIEMLKAADRAAFTSTVTAWANRLHAAGLRLSVTVHPKLSEPGGWDGPQAQDWAALGAVADDFRVMTYDYSWSTGPEGAIAPTEWVKQVATFALSLVPREKLSMGVSWYGYDWSRSPAASLTFADLPVGSFKIDPSSGERLYGPHMHFSGKEATRAKWLALSKLGLRRLSAWYCGSNDPMVWSIGSEK